MKKLGTINLFIILAFVLVLLLYNEPREKNVIEINKQELITSYFTLNNNINEVISNEKNTVIKGNSIGIDDIEYDELKDNGVKLIAHRGFSGLAPENTIPAYELASIYGYWGAETDIHVTADGEFVVMHDKTVDRTTNKIGEIKNMTLLQFKGATIDYGNNIYDYDCLTAPTFEEYLQTCLIGSLVPVIEIKSMEEKYINKFLDILESYNIIDNCIVISFDTDAIDSIRDKNSRINLQYLYSKIVDKELVDRASSRNINLGLKYTSITKDMIEYAHNKGIEISVWTVDDKDLYTELISNGVDYITTNNILSIENKLVHPYIYRLTDKVVNNSI